MSDNAPVRAHDNVGRGILFTVVAILAFGVQDAASKILTQDHSPFQIAMMRFWAFAAFSLWLVSRQAPLRAAMKSRRPGLQVLRALLLLLDIWAFAFAVRSVPLAELHAIVLIYPLLVTLIAIPILGERVGVFRLTAVSVGFAGAMIIVRPGGLPIDEGVIAAVLGSVAYAAYIALTRKVSDEDSAATSMVYVGVVGLIGSSLVGAFFWQPLHGMALVLTAVVMVTTCVGHGLMIAALSIAPASTLQPFNYLSLPWAMVLGLAVFGTWMDTLSLVGALVVVLAGLAVMARERSLAARGRLTSAAAAAPSKAAAGSPPH